VFGDDTTEIGPYVSSALNYTLRPDAVAVLGFRYSISATEVNAFRSSDTAVLFGQVTYWFTRKLQAAANGAYVISEFGNPISTSGLQSAEETGIRAAMTLNYFFTRWSNSSVSYSYDESDSPEFPSRAFHRNRVGLSVNFRY